MIAWGHCRNELYFQYFNGNSFEEKKLFPNKRLYLTLFCGFTISLFYSIQFFFKFKLPTIIQISLLYTFHLMVIIKKKNEKIVEGKKPIFGNNVLLDVSFWKSVFVSSIFRFFILSGSQNNWKGPFFLKYERFFFTEYDWTLVMIFVFCAVFNKLIWK